MSLSSIDSQTKTLHQWQNQQLGNVGSGGSKKPASGSLAALFKGSSMNSQVSSMVELTRHAMDGMGLDSASRVTFSQITRYRDQLTNEFNTGVKDGLAGLGVSKPAEVVFTLAGDGSLAAASADAKDQKCVQTWLNANSALGKDLRAALSGAGVNASTALHIKVNQSGALALADAAVAGVDLHVVQNVLGKSSLGAALYSGMQSLGVDAEAKFTIKANEDGTVAVESANGADKVAIQRFFDDNPGLVKKFRQIEALAGLNDARKAMQISPTEMRKRLQIESMASWWSGSGQANSYFGNYSGNNLSLLSSLNLSV